MNAQTTWTAKTPAGNEYEHTAYVDPYPGRKGSERVRTECGWCSGTGVYTGKSGYKFHTPAVGAVTTGCFHCEGRGYNSVLVSSLRASARRRVNADNARRAEAADWAAGAAEREAAEYAAALEEAYAEQARREAKPKGHVGTVGERFRKVNAMVSGYFTYETYDYVTGAPKLGAVIKFNLGGRTLVWFTSPRDAETSQDVVLSFTVKKHDQRDGEDQTVITRAIIH